MAIDLKNYALVIISAALLVSIGLNVQPEANYYCDSKAIKAYCGELSSTGKTCYVAKGIKAGSKLCDEGWKAIPLPEIVMPPPETVVSGPCPKINVIAYTENGKYFCDSIGAEAKCIKDETLEMPFLG